VFNELTAQDTSISKMHGEALILIRWIRLAGEMGASCPPWCTSPCLRQRHP